jgi:hypothetical protein
MRKIAENFVLEVFKVADPAIMKETIRHGLRVVRDDIVPELYNDTDNDVIVREVLRRDKKHRGDIDPQGLCSSTFAPEIASANT